MGIEYINEEEIVKCDNCKKNSEYGMYYLINKSESETLYLPKKHSIYCEKCWKGLIQDFSNIHKDYSIAKSICSSCSGDIRRDENYYHVKYRESVKLKIPYDGKMCSACWEFFIENFSKNHLY